MSEVENKLVAAKKAIRPFDILGIVGSIVAVVGVVFLILGIFIDGNIVVDRLFAIGVGLDAAAIVFVTATFIVARKEYDEYYRLQKEIKAKNK